MTERIEKTGRQSLLKRQVLWALFQVNTLKFRNATAGAVRYLEDNLRSVEEDPYTLSIITYALTLANSSQANTALNRLNSLATVKGLTTILPLRCIAVTNNVSVNANQNASNVASSEKEVFNVSFRNCH